MKKMFCGMTVLSAVLVSYIVPMQTALAQEGYMAVSRDQMIRNDGTVFIRRGNTWVAQGTIWGYGTGQLGTSSTHVETRPDGSRVTHYGDGSRRIERNGQQPLVIAADGRYTDQFGNRMIEHADGTIDGIDPGGRRIHIDQQGRVTLSAATTSATTSTPPAPVTTATSAPVTPVTTSSSSTEPLFGDPGAYMRK